MRRIVRMLTAVHRHAHPLMRGSERVAVAAALALFLVVALADLTGHRWFAVTGASMEPAIPRGALVIVRATSPYALQVGDVVTYRHRGETVTHRVAAIDDLGDGRVFETKGDANAVPDPERVEFEREVGIVLTHVPVAGHVATIVATALRPLLLLASLVAFTGSAVLLRRRRLATLPASV